MAFSTMIRRGISNNSHTLRSSWYLANNTILNSNVVNDNTNKKIVENGVGVGVGGYRCYSEARPVGGVGLPQYMRGAVYWEPNKPLTIEDFHMPRPKAGELLIKTKGGIYILTLLACFVFYVVWLLTKIEEEVVLLLNCCMFFFIFSSKRPIFSY